MYTACTWYLNSCTCDVNACLKVCEHIAFFVSYLHDESARTLNGCAGFDVWQKRFIIETHGEVAWNMCDSSGSKKIMVTSVKPE